ncbi:ankyrin repeat and SOCS box 2 [Pelobates cultripes]|uniref:Ankyrin repeat and SOCS box 2 n=1 Tax=Pelobates cultripes TaxID=61616 RepID=A0AAD1TN89_PELCU|nr:ankyrin repeat and SOCS box 2 [Pelobates cultripes]
MATQVSTSGQRRQVLGSEEYSLYSSLSEDELIQMAIEQSLLEGNSGQTTACSNQKQSDNLNERATAASLANRQTPRQTQLPQHNRSAQPSAAPSHNPGSNKATRRREKTPIERAIMNKDAETISKMIKSGQKLNEPNKDGWLPLHDAAYYGSLEVMKILLQAYPNSIDQRTLQEETATLISTTKGHIDCLLFMLQSGADPDIANKNKETPIYKACETKNVEALKLLIQYHADVNHRCNRGLVALHEAVSRNDLEIISILEKSGAKVDAKNIYGITPLFTAAQIGKVDLLRYLTKCGADINTQANDDATALFEASKNGHDEAVEFLLSQGADANKQNKHGFLPIHIAAKKRDNTEYVSLYPSVL